MQFWDLPGQSYFAILLPGQSMALLSMLNGPVHIVHPGLHHELHVNTEDLQVCGYAPAI